MALRTNEIEGPLGSGQGRGVDANESNFVAAGTDGLEVAPLVEGTLDTVRLEEVLGGR